MSVYRVYSEKANGQKLKKMVAVADVEEYRKLRGSMHQRELVEKARKGQQIPWGKNDDGTPHMVDAKTGLMQFCYSCLPGDDGLLAGSTKVSGSVGMDVDLERGAEESAEDFQRRLDTIPALVLAKKEELGLLMMERSASKGFHIVFRRRPELSQEENLTWASQLLGVKFDEHAKDITRVFFTTTDSAEDLLYLDAELFCIEECKDAKMQECKDEASAQPNSQFSILNYRASRTQNQACLSSAEAQPIINKVNSQLSFKGIPYAAIIAEWWKQQGGEPAEGERNTSLHRLAVNLRTICDNRAELLLQIMPRFGLSEQEMRSIIASATKDQPRGKTREIMQVLTALQQNEECRIKNEESGALPNPQFSILHSQSEDSTPPVMPKKLPKLIALLTKNTPALYKPAVAHAVFPPLATHLCGVEFLYTDNVPHEATLMNCLMSGTGTGKGCIDEPLKRIMADISRRDAENTRRETEWKKDCQRKGANKDKMVRPEGLVIQQIDPDMTKPALVTRMDEAEGHFVYVKLNELDLFEQLKGQTGKQHFQLMCLAFDPGAEYGQTRVGTQSVTARPQCRFNWNACTTILKGRRFFSKVLTDGPISRINFCTIPEAEIGGEQPVYGRYDAAFDEALKPYIDQLTSARGTIDCPQAYKLAKQLQQECAEFARLSQNEVYWNLSHRACVIAWLKACVLYVANGQTWEKSIEDFVRWSLEYDLWCKMLFFGADIERANYDMDRGNRRGPRNLLELLPDVFTIDDAARVRKLQGLDAQGTVKMVRNWKSRGYVTQISDISFNKEIYKNETKRTKEQ